MKSIAEITKNMTDWQPPVIPENIAHGDMPGDKVEIGEGHVQKANVIFKELLPMLEEASEKSKMIGRRQNLKAGACFCSELAPAACHPFHKVLYSKANGRTCDPLRTDSKMDS